MATTITARFECSRRDYCRVVVTWQSGRKYGIQGIFSADDFTGSVVFAGPQVGALYEGSASCDVFRCAVELLFRVLWLTGSR